MPHNGSSRRKTSEPIPILGDSNDEAQTELAASGYLGFEQFASTLVGAASAAKVRLFDMSNTIDLITLERRFSAAGVPAEWTPPLDLWAEVQFFWPAEYTTLSLYGDEAICDLYHSESVSCRHRNRQASLFTELEVQYQLPIDMVQRLDSDEGVERVARRIRQLFTDLVEHENIVSVEARATFSGDELRLSGVRAGHVWVLEDELTDEDLLTDAVTAIFQEMRTVLSRFAREFSGRRESTGE